MQPRLARHSALSHSLDGLIRTKLNKTKENYSLLLIIEVINYVNHINMSQLTAMIYTPSVLVNDIDEMLLLSKTFDSFTFILSGKSFQREFY